MIVALITFLAQQTQPPKGTLDQLTQLVTVVALGLGAAGTYLGLTSNARNQRLSAEKAEQEELEKAKSDVRRLTTELGKMEQREWETGQREQAAMRRLERAESQLADMKETLSDEKRRSTELKLRIDELERGR